MPAATKKRPPMEMEPGEGKAHESAESAAEETREGAEPDDAPKAKTNRKRSAKNAKATKAPMDSDCSCGAAKGKKCSCDGGCGSGYAKKMDRNDALTPQEYLAACDLGIQGRSRAYIRSRLDTAMNLTPSTVRNDLKCGNGSISEGEKCTKGAAQKVDPKAEAKKEFRNLMNNPTAAFEFSRARGSTKGVGNKIKVAGELAARVGGGFALGAGLVQISEGAMRGNLGEVSRGYRNMQLGAAATHVAAASKAGRMGKKELSKEFLKSAGRQAAIGVGQEAAIGAYAGFKRAGGAAGIGRNARRAYQGTRMRTSGMGSTPRGTGWASSAYDRPLPGRRDSVYANGFSPELDQLAI
jgi:hypothetical protein